MTFDFVSAHEVIRGFLWETGDSLEGFGCNAGGGKEEGSLRKSAADQSVPGLEIPKQDNVQGGGKERRDKLSICVVRSGSEIKGRPHTQGGKAENAVRHGAATSSATGRQPE